MSEIKRVVVNTSDNSVTVRLRGVRLSFPALFKPRAFSAEQEPKFSAAFLMPKTGDANKNAEYCEQAVKEVIRMAFKGRSPGADKLCFKDGATKAEVEGYGPEIMFLSSSSAKKIPVVDVDLAPLDEADGKPYAGCYVNATVRLWAQDNKWGKRVNGQLRTVQFLKDGEPFGDAGVDVEEEFEPVTGTDTDML
jgi:hypothetical protein